MRPCSRTRHRPSSRSSRNRFATTSSSRSVAWAIHPRGLSPDNPSLATLIARCPDVPRIEDLLTAFQAACGPVRRDRHRHLGHNDPGARIRPVEDLLPDVGRADIDGTLLLAGGILTAVHGYFSAGDPDFPSAPFGGVGELILRLRVVQRMERERCHPGDGPV